MLRAGLKLISPSDNLEPPTTQAAQVLLSILPSIGKDHRKRQSVCTGIRFFEDVATTRLVAHDDRRGWSIMTASSVTAHALETSVAAQADHGEPRSERIIYMTPRRFVLVARLQVD